jgi:inosine/xanthosine triphosphatase
MIISLGSHNPVKVAALGAALENWPHPFEVQTYDVPSGVDAQPWSDAETRQGAQQRAQAARQAAIEAGVDQDQVVLGIGMEGGLFKNEAGEVWSTVWIVVSDGSSDFWEANGGRMQIPDWLAPHLAEGRELGHVLADLTGRPNLKQDVGMFGVLTRNVSTRAQVYSSIARLALGLWAGRDWQPTL